MVYSGKYWYLDLKDWRHEEGFTQLRIIPLLFFGNNKTTLSKRFYVEFLGQAHWYLSARIHQDNDFNVTLDQA
jgi:hypothetical protein